MAGKKGMKGGGKREGAGRKPELYGEKTKQLHISVPESKQEEIKEKFQQVLKPYQIKHSKTVH